MLQEPTLHSAPSPLKLSQESFVVGVFWTLPGAACITHLLEFLGLIPEDLGLVWVFLVLQFGILHKGHHLLCCIQAAEKNSCENVPMFMCCSFSFEIA